MIRLARPAISETAIQGVSEILRSGNLIQGPHVGQFERALQEYLGIRQAIATSSGTAALHLALMALDITYGHEVICPAFTFPATANVIEIMGAKPVFVDISLADYCMDASLLASCITERTKAIMIVHEFGQAADMSGIFEVVRERDIPLIEDAACAIGTYWNNRAVGTFGTLGCYSFHPRKIITTGEGGAVTVHCDLLAQKIRALRNHGLTDQGGSDFITPGLNYRMTDFQALVGYYQLLDIEKEIETRIRQAARYANNLSSLAWLSTPSVFEDRRHIYQTYHVLLDDCLDRNGFIHSLLEKGVEANLGAQALHMLPFYQNKYHYKTYDYPKALRAYRQGLALPIGSHLTNQDVDYICDRLIQVHREKVGGK
ncbi:MAG: DegT/DnrJ/EryC1/StrS family aminotransferase [Pseudomonadota bacterium]|nr:DegT/DnrJ/EryC1/StrS family aminotransferase [Pseudomonadota bacterium]